MNLYLILAIYAAVFFGSGYYFRKYLRKSLFSSFLAGLILAQIALVFLSCFGFFHSSEGESSSLSLEMIFWTINLLTPIIVYASLLYLLYTKKM